jgi:NitT/TauT family transport system ATP-binding protein
LTTAPASHVRPLSEFRNIDLSLGGRTIVSNINLEIRPGEFLCIVGPSGCGKTTLLRLAAGLYRPDNGPVLYNGAPLTGPRRDIAVVFQDYADALLPWRTAAGNVSLALETQGVPRPARRDRVAALLKSVGLQAHAEKYPNQMSGGMQQRLQIARCLAQEPTLWLMDEPFGALDAITRQSLQDGFMEVIAGSGATVLFVTHDLEEAIYLGDRVIAMSPNPGRITAVYDVPLPRPRDHRSTPELPEFLRLRRTLYDFIESADDEMG